MGGTTSRRVTVEMENEDGTGVVKISESMARRLAGQSGNIATAKEVPSKETIPASSPTAAVPQVPLPPYPSTFPSGISQQEHAAEIKRIENYYKNRQSDLEQRNKELYQITKEQFETALKEVEDKIVHHTPPPVCQDAQTHVTRCYENNRGQTLLCSKEARRFIECVEHMRGAVVTKSA